MKTVLALLLAAAVLSVLGFAKNRHGDITVIAQRYSFSPEQIIVKKNSRVTLLLKTEDVEHGLVIERLDVEADIAPGSGTTISFIPKQVGTFEGKCSHFCGKNHGMMHFKVVVVE